MTDRQPVPRPRTMTDHDRIKQIRGNIIDALQDLLRGERPFIRDADEALVLAAYDAGKQSRDALLAAVKEDIADAKAVCGGDGKGCEAFRDYYDNDERRYRKCGQCPMEALSATRAVMKEAGL